MSLVKEMKSKKILAGRLSYESDLLKELTKICVENNISLGRIEAIGAVKKASLGYYNTTTFEYEYHNFDQPMELLNLTGNVSQKDGEIMVHAHVTLADKESKAIGGHLFDNTIVFACEYIIEAFDGDSFVREKDSDTKLFLWPEK